VQRKSTLPQRARALPAVAALMICAMQAHGVDNYDGTDLTIPAVNSGNAIFTNMVVTPGSILGVRGGTPDGNVDSFIPSSEELTIPAVTVGTDNTYITATNYYNVTIKVGTLVSAGSVAGADVFNGSVLIIPSVQVAGGSAYTDVVITVGSIVSAGAGMPASVQDSYDPAGKQLTIAAVMDQADGKVFTNAIVTVGSILSVGPVSAPNVVGLTQTAATTTIHALGLVAGTVTTESSPTVVAGSVISQSPATGASVTPGSGVNLTVSSGPPGDTLTYHYDATRSGLNSGETALTPGTVNVAGFGKVGEFAIDGRVDGAVLYVTQLAIPGTGTKNVIYFGTENDSVYAVDAGSVSGSSATVLWKASVLGAGETTVPEASIGCGNVDPVGVTSTPVIDRSRNAIYVLSFSTDGNGHFFHRLHALSLTSGQEMFGGPVTIIAAYPRTGPNGVNGTVIFEPQFEFSRAALLESGNTIYTVWAGQYGECGSFSGWVIGYNADTLAQSAVNNLNPNSNRGGIWLGGGGAAADGAGDIFIPTGATSDTIGPGTNGDYPQSLARLSGSGTLSLLDFFAPFNAVTMNDNDLSLAASNALLLPDLVDATGKTRHLATAAGKAGVLYVVDRDTMGGWNPFTTSVYQQITLAGNYNFSSPAYFNQTLYIGPAGTPLQAYGVSQAVLSNLPTSQSTNSFGPQGTVPSVSSNGATGGIVWTLDAPNGVLYAFDATNLATQFYNSSQAPLGRDHFATVAGHFITPVVANGRVYFGTASTIAVFGLLNP
jgi:PASTA domain-containing protein